MITVGSGSYIRGITKSVIYQLDLYGQLASVEWKEEKIRLSGMLLSLLFGFTFFLCLLLALSSMLLILSWDTQYRNWVMTALVGFYGVGVLIAWQRFRSLGNRGNKAFSGIREELAVDVALLRSKMDQ